MVIFNSYVNRNGANDVASEICRMAEEHFSEPNGGWRRLEHDTAGMALFREVAILSHPF